MKKKPLKDIAASVRARLAALAKKEGKTFDSILLLYFQERLLARLAVSRHRESFILKGALLFFARASAGERLKARPTKDVDLLARKLTPDLDEIAGVFREMAAIKLDDGVVLAPGTVEAERIKEDADYEGVRVHLEARLGQPKGRRCAARSSSPSPRARRPRRAAAGRRRGPQAPPSRIESAAIRLTPRPRLDKISTPWRTAAYCISRPSAVR